MDYLHWSIRQVIDALGDEIPTVAEAFRQIAEIHIRQSRANAALFVRE